jgi:predicted AAA+ superfamily ATPase
MKDGLERVLERAERLMARIESVLPSRLTDPDWTASIAFRYRKRGNGHGVLEPVRQVGAIRLSDLQEIDDQKLKIQRNTLQFVKGLPANNVLLTGARGTGKSSLVKACLHEFAADGLRLIEVDKSDLADLPDIVDVVADRPERFVVFCDDLSFEDGDPGYKALKSILDGSVSAVGQRRTAARGGRYGHDRLRARPAALRQPLPVLGRLLRDRDRARNSGRQ